MEVHKMEGLDSNSVEIMMKSDDNEGIIIQDTVELINKDEESETTEYFLHVESQEENQDAEFESVDGDCEENEEAQFVAVDVDDADQIILHDKDVILWNELCRICANGSDRFIPIFSGEGLEHSLRNKIHTYLPLRVSENDSLPHQVCYNCAATLLAWHEMFKGCLNAQQRLLELQAKFKEQFYNDAVVEEENIEQTVLEVETANGEDQQESAKQDNTEETAEVVNIVESERSKGPQCTCTGFKEFQKVYKPTLPAIKSRKKAQTSSKSVKKKATRTIKRKPVKKLAKVKIEQDIRSIISKHEVEDFENLNFIEMKVENNVSRSGDESTVDNVNADVQEDATSASENSKSKRSRRKRSSPGLECTQCNKKFRMYNSYQIHMRIHTGEKPYTCHICGKQFGQTGSLYYHLKHVHGGVKNHACDICGRCFAMKTAMEDHRRIHTGERPYVCDSCGKTFKTKASLYIHSKIHTNEYPFKCSYCKKLFRWKQQMISHLTTHTGEKNHICDICGKGFGVKNELTRHRRTHSLDKPFTCQKCGVSFGQKRYLTNHNRTRHKTKAASN